MTFVVSSFDITERPDPLDLACPTFWATSEFAQFGGHHSLVGAEPQQALPEDEEGRGAKTAQPGRTRQPYGG